MMHWDSGWSSGEWALMSVLMVVFWTFLVVAVFVVLRGRRTLPDESGSTTSPAQSNTADTKR